MAGLRSLMVLIVVVTASCGGTSSVETGSGDGGESAVFGAGDAACPSLTLANEEGDEQRVRAAARCLLDAVAAGTAARWDASIPTVEGDPVFHRFDFDGREVLIVRDDRADTFGYGSVRAQRCATVEAQPGEWLPVGIDCHTVDHPGFAAADSG